VRLITIRIQRESSVRVKPSNMAGILSRFKLYRDKHFNSLRPAKLGRALGLVFPMKSLVNFLRDYTTDKSVTGF
jgi:hypothetical protein